MPSKKRSTKAAEARKPSKKAEAAAADKAAPGTVPFLQCFWSLADTDAATRQTAVASLVAHLRAAQSEQHGAAKAPLPPADADAAEDDAFRAPAAASEAMSYTMTRLVRGLCSGRSGARQGFSLALAAVLRAFPRLLPLPEAVRCVSAVSAIGGKRQRNKMRGHEQRDHLFAKLFGFAAIQRSGRLALAGESATAGEAAARMVAELAELLGSKTWLRAACAEAISVVACGVVPAVFASHVAPALEEASLLPDATDTTEAGELNAEHVCIASALLQYGLEHWASTKRRGRVSKHAPAVVQRAQSILAPLSGGLSSGGAGLDAVVGALVESTSTFPSLHAAWPRVLMLLLRSDAGAGDDDGGIGDGDGDAAARAEAEAARAATVAAVPPAFADFWRTVVNGRLATSTHERRATALLLVRHVLAAETAAGRFARVAASMPLLLAPIVLKCLANNLPSVRQTYLHTPARETMDAVVATAKADGSRQVAAAALNVLLARDPAWDTHTRSTGVASLQALLDEPAMRRHADFLKQVFRNPMSAGDAARSARRRRRRGSVASTGSAAGASDGGGDARGDGDDLDEEEEEAAALRVAETRRVWALDGLCAATRASSLAEDEGFTKDVVAFLTTEAFFAAREGAEGDAGADAVEVPPAVRAAARTRLLGLLADLSSRRRGRQSGAAAGGAQTEGGLGAQWALQVFETFSDVSKGGQRTLVAADGEAQLDESVAAAASEASKAARALSEAAAVLHKADGDDAATGKLARQADTFASLLAHVAIAMLADAADGALAGADGDDGEEGDIALALSDLQQCMLRLCAAAVLRARELQPPAAAAKTPASKQKKKKGKKARRASVEAAEEALGAGYTWETDAREREEAMAIFTDTLLSLLSRPSALLRDVSKGAFRVFAEDLTEEALDTLLRVIHDDGGDGGDDALLDGDGSDDDSADDAARRGKRRRTDGGSDESGSGSGSDSDSGSGSDSDGDDSDSAGGAAEAKEGGDGSDESDDEPLSAANDADMEKYDDMIASMLRARKEERSRARQLREQTLHFRYRALDLVEVAVTRLAGNPLLLRALLALLRALKACASKLSFGKTAAGGDVVALQQRIRGVFNRLTRVRLPSVGDGDGEVPPAVAVQALQDVLGLAWAAPSPAFVEAASSALWAVLRVLRVSSQARGEGAAAVDTPAGLDEAEVGAAIGARLKKYLTKKNVRLSGRFFLDCVRRAPFIMWQCAGDIAAAARGDAASSYRRVEAFEMLTILSVAAAKAAAGDRGVQWSAAAEAASRAAAPACVGAFVSAVSDAAVASSSAPTFNAKRMRAVLAAGVAILALPGAALAARAESLAVDLGRIRDATGSGAVRGQVGRVLRLIGGDAEVKAAVGDAKAERRARSNSMASVGSAASGAGGGAGGGARGAAAAAKGKRRRKDDAGSSNGHVAAASGDGAADAAEKKAKKAKKAKAEKKEKKKGKKAGKRARTES